MENGIIANKPDDFSEHSKPSIIVPGERGVTLSRSELEHQSKLLQERLVATSDLTQRTIAVALPNSLELVILFLAITRKRGIAALLNPNNKENEFASYLDDIDPTMVIVSRGAYDADSDLVRAARRHGSGIAECYWDGQDVVLNTVFQKERMYRDYGHTPNTKPAFTDIALLLHTSGTTGRPNVVSSLLLSMKTLFDFCPQVPLTHMNLDTSASKCGPSDRVL